MSLNIQSHGPQMRYQMQPATASQSSSASRGTNFAKKLGQAGDTAGHHKTDEAKPKVKKRKVPKEFSQVTDLEIEARMLEQQRQSSRANSPQTPTTRRLGE